MKAHFMSWAPQDWRTSRVRSRSAVTADPILRLVYFELLNALWEHGGTLPNDPDFLSDELMLPPAEIARCIPILLALGERSGGGGLAVVKHPSGDRLANARITRDLDEKDAFRASQAERGRRGAAALHGSGGPASASGKHGGGPASATPSTGGGLAVVKHPSEKTLDPPNLPLPIPLPSPLPSPLPLPNGGGGDATPPLFEMEKAPRKAAPLSAVLSDYTITAADGSTYRVPVEVLDAFEPATDDYGKQLDPQALSSEEIDRAMEKLQRKTALGEQRPATAKSARLKVINWLEKAKEFKTRDQARVGGGNGR